MLSPFSHNTVPSPAAFKERRILEMRNETRAFEVRTAEIAAMKPDGTIIMGMRRIPSMAVFEEACAAFVQGTVFRTPQGGVAVEDLQVGDWVTTRDGAQERITWIGSIRTKGDADETGMQLTRIMGDSFGLNRPEGYLSLGPGAGLLKTSLDSEAADLGGMLTTPAHRYVDFENVIPFRPPSPVRLFHICTQSHSALLANGLPVESYHPGPDPVSHLSEPLRRAYMALFPHIEKLGDFGPAKYARISDRNSA